MKKIETEISMIVTISSSEKRRKIKEKDQKKKER